MVKVVIMIFLHAAFLNASASQFRHIGPRDTDIKDFLICNDGQKLYAAFGNAVKIYEIETGEQIGTVDFGTDRNIHALALSGDQSLLAAGFCDGQIQIRNLDNGSSKQVRHTENLITSIDISPDKEIIVAGTIRGEIFIMVDGSEIRTLNLHDDAITRVVFSADGRFVGSTGLDGRAYLTWIENPDNKIILSEGSSPCRDIIINRRSDNILVAYQDGRVRYFRQPQTGYIVNTGTVRLGGWVTGLDYLDDDVTWAGCTTNGKVIVQTKPGIRYSANLKRSVNKVLFVQGADHEITVIVSLYNAGLAIINGYDLKMGR
jgi:WD40 repeat protein